MLLTGPRGPTAGIANGGNGGTRLSMRNLIALPGQTYMFAAAVVTHHPAGLCAGVEARHHQAAAGQPGGHPPHVGGGGAGAQGAITVVRGWQRTAAAAGWQASAGGFQGRRQHGES